MKTLTISPDYQIAIPKDIREAIGLESGQKVQVIAYDNRIELIPVRPMSSMRGFLEGIDTGVHREGERL